MNSPTNHSSLPPIPGPVASSGNLWKLPTMRLVGRWAIRAGVAGAALGVVLGIVASL